VDHVFTVNVLQSLRNLVDDVGSFRLFEPSKWLRLQLTVYLTAWSVLQDQVELLCIKEETIHRENVLVAQMAPDLNLSLELPLNTGIDELLFVENFEGDHKF
jgi:hypothetical protein